jgi:hypothetical protein
VNLPVRVSDDDRQMFVDRLCRACGAGSLTLDEFEGRIDLVYQATDRSEMERIVADLPVEQDQSTQEGQRMATAPRRRWSVGLVGGTVHQGRWRIPARFTHVGLVGSARLDLGAASVSGPNTTITVFNLVGSTDVRVPSHINVEVEGFSLVGGRNVEAGNSARLESAPLVRLRVFSLIGGTRVRSSNG